MPIPMLPPPPPYVAPDLRPIVATPGATLNLMRLPGGRVVERGLAHGMWVASEGAPLELRFHRREDGTVWGEQATYADGDRAAGIARASAGAHTQVMSQRVVDGMGVMSSFVRYTIVGGAGQSLRTWTSSLCGTSTTVRLDRPNSPDDPSYPASWEGCEREFEGAYVLGRLTGLDRGWAMQLPSRVGAFPRLAAGSYQLRVELDPLEAIADADRSNNSVTVPLTVRTPIVRDTPPSGCEFCPSLDPATGMGTTDPAAGGPARSRSSHAHESTSEPEWYADRLELVEAALESRRARREGGPVPRVGEAAPSAPADVDLPDLRTAPSYGIRVDTTTRKGQRRDLLRFGALTWNAGPGPLEVEAFRETGSTLSAYQVFYRDAKRSTRQGRGTLVWHDAPGHDHFHLTAFAAYSLTRLDGSVARDGGKHSWCIVDTDQVDTTRPGVSPAMQMRAGDCGSDSGSLWARLSLSVGSGDYYGPGLAGQSFDITTLPNGSYQVRLEANPNGVIAEADHANNVSIRTVTLGGTRGNRTVRVRPHKLVKDITADFGECKDC